MEGAIMLTEFLFGVFRIPEILLTNGNLSMTADVRKEKLKPCSC
jgi:hypothetical protein